MDCGVQNSFVLTDGDLPRLSWPMIRLIPYLAAEENIGKPQLRDHL